jgi:hypothetical protein
MKLDYLSDISDRGKYTDVVSENLIRLFDFEQTQTKQLADLIYQRLIVDKQALDLATVDFIESINCQLTLQASSTDKGIMKTDRPNSFICEPTEQTYIVATEYMKAVDSGHNWLCDTSADNVDFLYSAGGTW